MSVYVLKECFKLKLSKNLDFVITFPFCVAANFNRAKASIISCDIILSPHSLHYHSLIQPKYRASQGLTNTKYMSQKGEKKNLQIVKKCIFSLYGMKGRKSKLHHALRRLFDHQGHLVQQPV